MKKLAAALVLVAAGAVFAETTPVMVSLVTPVQAPSSDYDVSGVRLSLVYGQSRGFTGLDLGIANRATEDFTGIGIGGANIADGYFCGGHIGLVNWNGNESRDWDKVSKGAQIGLVNYAEEMDKGIQIGILNIISRGGWAPVLPFVNGRF